MTEAACEHCGEIFFAADNLAGGITNCPRCGRAVDVPGLRDAWWRALQALAAIGVVAVAAIAYVLGGLPAAVIAGGVAAGLCWLASRAL